MAALRFIAAFTLLTLLATVATAQCVVRSRAVVANTVAAQAVVAAPGFSVVPAYGAFFDATAQEVPKLRDQLAAQEARIRLLEEARDGSYARLAVIENKLGIVLRKEVAAPAAPKEEKAVVKAGAALPALLARTCIQCHQEGRNPKGGLVLVDASGKNLINISCEQRLEILRRINLEEGDPHVMPPKGKGALASDKEAAELLEILTRSIPSRK